MTLTFTIREWVFLIGMVLSVGGFFGTLIYVKNTLTRIETMMDKQDERLVSVYDRIHKVERRVAVTEELLVETKELHKDVKELIKTVSNLVGRREAIQETKSKGGLNE
jgi:uncharacterized protein YoxC